MRLLWSAAAGLGTSLIVALVLTVADLYLSGHGLGSLTGPLLDWPRLGIHLSLADILMLGAGGVAATITWRRSGQRGGVH